LKGMQIEENAREILERISSLNWFEWRGRKLRKTRHKHYNTQNKYTELGKKLGKFSDQFEHLAAETLPVETASKSLKEGENVVYQQKMSEKEPPL